MMPMRRLALPLLFAAATSACVSVAPPPDPHGVYMPGQRLVVFIYQAPGPWIVSGADSKLESAAQISPLGFAVQGMEDSHTLSVSKAIQQYLPRPRYDDELQDALMKELRLHISSAPLQSGLQAGVPADQIQRWNRARNQEDWRSRYFQVDPDLPAPRNYSRGFGLDDALVLDVNLSFGTTSDGAGDLMPDLAASWRVYRGLNSRQVWDHLNEDVDQASTMTLVDIETTPPLLTGRLEALAPKLGQEVGHEFARAFGLLASTAPARGGLLPPPKSAPAGAGLLPLSYLLSLSSAPADAPPPPRPTPAAVHGAAAAPTAAPAAVAVSTAAASAPASISTTTAAAPPPPPPPAVPVSSAPAASP